MSLNVSETLIQQAAAGEVDEKAFVETIRQSLPYAWNIVDKLSTAFIRRVRSGQTRSPDAIS